MDSFKQSHVGPAICLLLKAKYLMPFQRARPNVNGKKMHRPVLDSNLRHFDADYLRVVPHYNQSSGSGGPDCLFLVRAGTLCLINI